MTTPGSVRIRFPWNHYPSGKPTRGDDMDAGKQCNVRMRLTTSRRERHCTACGVAIPPGEEHYAPDWTPSYYAIDVNCDVARTTTKGDRR